MTLIRRLAPAAAIGALAAAFYLPATAQTADTAPQTAQAEAAAPQILPDLWLGAEDAPVEFIEYASFTCSHCADFSTNVFPKLKAEYIDTGKIRFAQRDVYFERDPVSLWVALLARCDESKFYPVTGMLFESQREWLSGKTGEEVVANLRKTGAKAGFSNAQMDACWSDEPKVQNLAATSYRNMEADEITSTPTFIIAGEKVGNLPWDQLKSKLDEKLAAAQ